jgi:hypothetical protein
MLFPRLEILLTRSLGRLKTSMNGTWARAAVVVLAVITVGVTTTETIHDRAVTNCQAEYNNAFARSLTEHSDLAQQDRDAVKRAIITALTPDPGLPPADVLAHIRQIREQYVTSENRIDAMRRTHPYPTLPSRACQ